MTNIKSINKYIGLIMILCCIPILTACGSNNHTNRSSNKPETTKQASNMVNNTLRQINYEKSIINKHILNNNVPMRIITNGNTTAGTNTISIGLTNKNNMKSVNIKALWRKIYDTHAKYPNVRVVIFSNGGNLVATGTVGSAKLSSGKGNQHQTEGLNQKSQNPYNNAKWRKISKDYNKSTERIAKKAQKENQPIINNYKKSLNQNN